jgi:hypothetical protein
VALQGAPHIYDISRLRVNTQTNRRGKPYCFFNLGAIWGCVVNAMPQPPYPRERPGTHRTGDWMGDPGPVWTGVENLDHSGIRPRDSPARSALKIQIIYNSVIQILHITVVMDYALAIRRIVCSSFPKRGNNFFC